MTIRFRILMRGMTFEVYRAVVARVVCRLCTPDSVARMICVGVEFGGCGYLRLVVCYLGMRVVRSDLFVLLRMFSYYRLVGRVRLHEVSRLV